MINSEIFEGDVKSVPSVEYSSPADRKIRERLTAMYIQAHGCDISEVPLCFKTDPSELVDSSEDTVRGVKRVLEELDWAQQKTRQEPATKTRIHVLGRVGGFLNRFRLG